MIDANCRTQSADIVSAKLFNRLSRRVEGAVDIPREIRDELKRDIHETAAAVRKEFSDTRLHLLAIAQELSGAAA